MQKFGHFFEIIYFYFYKYLFALLNILSLFQDKKDNLWLGLDIGVSHVNLSSRFGTYNDSSGQIGTVYASIIYDNHLYLGTNQGLFIKQKDFDGPFNFIAGTSGQVWKLKMIDNLLFCGHNKGTLIIEDQRIKTRIFDASTVSPASRAASKARNNPPSSRASAWRRKVYSSSTRLATAVFSCMDWSGNGPKSDRKAATIQPERYK